MSSSKHRRQIAAAFVTCALRATPQRYAVFGYLLENPVHATAEEIFRAVNQNDPRSSRATVYNTLHTLVAAGLVREVALEGRAARFDANLHRHHHFVCERCGSVEDMEWFEMPALPPGRALDGRSVRGYDVVFRGLCARCNKSEEQDA